MAGRKGAIAFGLVYIPVELYPATQDDAVRFNQLAKESMQRVRYVKTCPDCNRELGPEDIVRGYQYEKGKYVVVSDEELDAIKTDADRAMKIVQFVDLQEVPPVYFEKPYQVMAQPGGEKPLELLRLAMVEEGKAAIGTTVLGNSETPLALIPYGDDLVMMTLHYQSEVRDLPKPAERPAVGEAELDMAKRLVESMAEPFDPARFKNAYQEKLMGLIQDKIAGKQVTPEKPASQPANVINLMDALAASLKARTGEDAGGAEASSSTEGGKAPKPKRKPPAKRAG
ncbi:MULTISPECIES: non-homologous end joining protein Ku [Gordonibacter]|uniref:non-homologous end joining protein Ku n=1 Tax=Gordonibacter TaxID=644652 RepID=UPI001E03A139|nr:MULTISPECIES: Ku protein [Gordonibacter]MDN4510363.1 Ku protein [Gordonibacter sp. RACS_AR49]HJF63981.1 Ku protein [Gordonibacter urolithinfaciens]